MAQIAVRGTVCTAEDFAWCREQGFRALAANLLFGMLCVLPGVRYR